MEKANDTASTLRDAIKLTKVDLRDAREKIDRIRQEADQVGLF